MNEDGSIFKNKSFWGILVTQFLGAFNDNVFKQIVLLLAVPTAAAIAKGGVDGQVSQDIQGWANFIFALPFVIFSGVAGLLSDRFSKRYVIVLAKVAEIVVMILGMLAFLGYPLWREFGTWSVLFLMGTQSAFFGPGKYGILPELFPKGQLAKANGFILMTTFLAIIFGVVAAGGLMKLCQTGDTLDPRNLWFGSAICILIAIVGTGSSLLIRQTQAAKPDAKLCLADWGLAAEVRSQLKQDRPLLKGLLVSSVFWMVSGITLLVVNRLGKTQLQVDLLWASLLVASTAIGIMFGSILAAVVFKRLIPRWQVTLGLYGMCIVMIALGLWRADQSHMLGYWGCVTGLFLLGAFAAIYSVPLQVFLQDRPPAHLKGRMVGTMNQANFIGILLSGPLYQAFEWLVTTIGVPISAVFWCLAILVLPLAIFYRLGK